MRLVGLDPGFASLGWVHCEWDGDKISIVDGGVVITKKSHRKTGVRSVDDNMRRVKEQARALVKIFDGAAIVCTEAFNLGVHGTRHSAAKQGGSSATIAAVCEVLKLPLLQATPHEIKKAVCGQAKASKVEVQDALAHIDPSLSMVLERLSKAQREHCSDAFGAVVACLDTEEARLCLTTERLTNQRS